MWWKEFLSMVTPCGKCVAIALCIGAFCFALCGIIALCKKLRGNRLARMEKARAMQYTLPERDNEFVRARLKTVLCKEDEEACEGVELSYARELLAKLGSVKLSVAERLEISELNALFALYMRKETLTASEVRMLGDAFGRLLKLSAKYAL